MHVEIGTVAARGVKWFAYCYVPVLWSCLLKSCYHQGVVYNGDADDQDLGNNDENENCSCDEFENCASTVVIRCGLKLTAAVMVYACTIMRFVSHANANFSY